MMIAFLGVGCGKERCSTCYKASFVNGYEFEEEAESRCSRDEGELEAFREFYRSRFPGENVRCRTR